MHYEDKLRYEMYVCVYERDWQPSWGSNCYRFFFKCKRPKCRCENSLVRVYVRREDPPYSKIWTCPEGRRLSAGGMYDICDLWPQIQMVLLIVRPWEQDMTQHIAMAQHITHKWSYVILGAIRPLSNTSHNYPYSCGYKLSIVLYTISMVLHVVSLHVHVC